MKRINKILILIVISSIGLNCVDTFLPEIDEQVDYLVVEGLVTNENKSYLVKLSRTGGLGEEANSIAPEPGALVSITDDLGNVFPLEDISLGRYVTDQSQFIGEIGREYTLHIETGKGEKYESYPVKMIPVPPVQKIYHEIDVRENLDFVEDGVNIYLDTYDEDGLCQFYRFQFQETWEVYNRWPYPPIEKRRCWNSASSQSILIGSSVSLSQSKIVKYPLIFVSSKNDKLKIKYSILVKQLSINRDEYDFWEKLKNSNESIGTMFDPIPSSIKGNIYNCDDKFAPVLGYFSVSAVASKRYFINYNQHNFDIYDKYRDCPETELMPGMQFYYLDSVNNVVTIQKECVDCTLEGTNNRPAYWDEEIENVK